MKVACLVSGGKDSIYACYVAMQYGWEVTHLITIHPQHLSWMYHKENISLVPLIAESMGIPLLVKESGAEKEKELDDAKELIAQAQVEGIVSGAVASEYQRTRIEKICHELGVKSFTPLWHKRQETILFDMLDAHFEVIITAVAASGLDGQWLGRTIDEGCIEELLNLKDRYHINVAGEGGEYETIVIDCPLYRKRIAVERAHTTWDGNRGSYEIEEAALVEK
ncbi:MAG: TIGR00289 family protein [Thermoplasmata archaeon]|nr:MAG: TIGR00289 family protein [Thermoplasmata archaeon]